MALDGDVVNTFGSEPSVLRLPSKGHDFARRQKCQRFQNVHIYERDETPGGGSSCQGVAVSLLPTA